jgi:O-antigen ligase
MCLISGIYFSWIYLQKGGSDVTAARTGNRMDYVVVVMLVWLLHMSNSQTSLSCLLVALSLHCLSRVPFIKRKPSRLLILVTSGAILFLIGDEILNLKAFFFGLLSRDETLTDRTDLWAAVLTQRVSPIFGAGFMSFWTGARMEAIWTIIGTARINQAHNGYLEQYLNLGYLGIAFLVVIILSALLGIYKQLNTDSRVAMLRLTIVLVALLYNYTEASFYGLNDMWVLLLIAAIVPPHVGRRENAVPRRFQPHFSAVNKDHT